MNASGRLSHYEAILAALHPIKTQGRVLQVVGSTLEVGGLAVPIGGECDVYPSDSTTAIKAEVIGFKGDTAILMGLGEMRGLTPGSRIVYRGEKATLHVSTGLMGRVLDGLGAPLDELGPLPIGRPYPLYAEPINPLKRPRVQTKLDLGIRAINALLTCAKGQRVGIFAGSGVGKSALLGAIARHTDADVNVVALIGERGREVREFLEQNLGHEGLQKTVMVVATSDQPPLIRLRAAYVATTIAEYFSDQGHDVLVMMDSLTRLAMAQREIGLASGELPMARGYTPSVFALLPKLLERVGNVNDTGSITGLYTVLIDNEEMNEPLSDAIRSIVDGHIILSRDLAAKHHYPAIDILNSLSRVMNDVTTLEHQAAAGRLRELLAIYQESQDLISIGAYVNGSNSKIDQAIRNIESINDFLCQDRHICFNMTESINKLIELFGNAP